jgi:hypothetical protein
VGSDPVMKNLSSSLPVEAARLLQQLLGRVEKGLRAKGGILKTAY